MKGKMITLLALGLPVAGMVNAGGSMNVGGTELTPYAQFAGGLIGFTDQHQDAVMPVMFSKQGTYIGVKSDTVASWMGWDISGNFALNIDSARSDTVTTTNSSSSTTSTRFAEVILSSADMGTMFLGHGEDSIYYTPGADFAAAASTTYIGSPVSMGGNRLYRNNTTDVLGSPRIKENGDELINGRGMRFRYDTPVWEGLSGSVSIVNRDDVTTGVTGGSPSHVFSAQYTAMPYDGVKLDVRAGMDSHHNNPYYNSANGLRASTAYTGSAAVLVDDTYALSCATGEQREKRTPAARRAHYYDCKVGYIMDGLLPGGGETTLAYHIGRYGNYAAENNWQTLWGVGFGQQVDDKLHVFGGYERAELKEGSTTTKYHGQNAVMLGAIVSFS